MAGAINQRLILEAAHRKTVSSEVVVHVSIAAAEVQAACERATYRTAPIVAAGTNTAERAIAEVAVARHGPFER